MAAVLPLVLVAGCGDKDSGSSGPADHASSSSLPSQTELKSYFTAVAAYDPDGLAAAEKVAADGSPAQAYATYLGEYAASATAAAQPVAPSPLEEVDGGYKACGGTGKPDECAVWSDLQGRDGKLVGFTVNGVDVADSVVDLSGQPPIESPGVYSVQPDHAYRSPQSHTLFVTVTVTADAAALSPKSGVYIEDKAILHSVPTRAPATIAAGASTPVVLAFPEAQDAALNGSVTFDLGIEGAGTESIGFGLAPVSAAG